MKRLKRKRLYVPALSIVAAALILLVLTAVSTFRNLEREQARNLTSLEKQGLTLLRTLEAGARAGMTLPEWGEDSVGALLEETGREETVAYLYLCDADGHIVHHSLRSIEGTVSSWKPLITRERPVVKRIRSTDDGSHVLDIAKQFMPLAPLSIPEKSRWQTFHSHHGELIVLGMRMDAYDAARKSDIHHALIMAAIVVALGSGALFFLLVIQNVYLLDRSLKKTQDLNRQIILNMADGLVGIDQGGSVTVINPLACELLRIEKDKLNDVGLDAFLNLADAGIQSTLETGVPVIDREIEFKDRDGRTTPLAISATPIETEGGQQKGVVVLLRDLREIKRLEAEVRRSEKMAAIGRLAASVAHEVRNPLSSIRGFAGYLGATLKKWPKEQGYAEIMIREVDRINQVISDLLSLSRPISIEKTAVPVRSLLNHVASLIRTDADARGISVSCRHDENVREITVDWNQMTQSLLNLMINALKSVDNGTGSIELGAAPAPDGDGVEIWVEDNGTGIPAADIEQIFEPYFTTRDDGTGLGLAIVENIVENHGGTIRVDSPPPGRRSGSRFVICLPKLTTGDIHGTQGPGGG